MLTPVPLLLLAIFLVNGLAMVLAVPPMRKRAAHLGFALRTYRRLGALQLLAAVALVAGLIGSSWIGVAAACGLATMMVGAVYLHARQRDSFVVYLPALVVGAIALLSAGWFAFES